MRNERQLLGFDDYNIPKYCRACGGVMIFKGVGEYRCEDCNDIDYDDYGKARLYIEQHKGATASEIEEGTGVKQKTIRHMLREGRLEITADSRAFLHCDVCGKAIRSGRLCKECEINYHRHIEDVYRKERNINLQGFGHERQEAVGEKRFKLDR